MANKKGVLKNPFTKSKEKYLLLFIVSFVGMMIAFIPTMVLNKGIFLYYGDFNSQQMMFYVHANEAVRDGAMAWDWGTDLGANFVGSYSFYLLGSPFFWLSTLFPLKLVPYLMPWLLALKTSVAAVTAYAYVRRFVKNPNSAFIGALLYAFSGFQIYNVFFNHFHDATAFFPLMLLGFEKLTQDKKKGFFALSVAICATVSYFFFVCDVVFMVIYFFIRCTDKEFKINMKTFGLLLLEAVVGVMISAFILLPSVMDVFTNPRVSSYLYGIDLVVYNEAVRIPRIIQAFFMLPDMPARINILSSDNARWASIAGYLPMFSMCGVIAFMRTRKKHWATKMIAICGIMACIPVLNSAFVLFNSSYYARWFYMPILLMCMMTAKVIDEKKSDLKKGFIPVVVVCAVFLGIGLLPTREDEKTVFMKIAQYIELYYIQAIVTIIMTIMLFIVIYQLKHNKKWYRFVNIMTAVACIVCMTSSVMYGAAQDGGHEDYIERGINGGDHINLAEFDGDMSDSQNTFYRIDTSENVDNWCMFWGLSSMRTFHSVVPTSIMDFYSCIGQTRDVASRMEPKLYALRSMFSVKYYFKEQTETQIKGLTKNDPPETVTALTGFKYVGSQNGFNIYKNENFIPMGFAYDKYTTYKDVDDAIEVLKPNLLLDALALKPEQVAKYADVLSYEQYSPSKLTEETYVETCEEKQAESCYYFKEDTNGFDAKIDLEKSKLVFFSVPYEEGWTAQVNGKDVDIEKASFGFMAILCPEGDNTITFRYKTQGLFEGKILTIAGIVILVAYLSVAYVYGKKDKKESVNTVKKAQNTTTEVDESIDLSQTTDSETQLPDDDSDS